MGVTPPSPIQQTDYKTHVVKQMGQMLADIFLIIVFEASKTTGMKQDEKNYNFRITHVVRLVAMLMGCILNHIFFL